MNLRPYQEEAIAAVLRDWEVHTDVLGVAATGAGKTVVFLALLLQVLTPGKRGLILAHRQELIEQPVERIRQIAPEWAQTGVLETPRIGVVMANQDECDRALTVATVQTLASERRLARLLSHGAPDYIITDEAHHATADSYQALYAALRSVNPEMRHLGVTATPLRADGDGLAKVFQKVSFTLGIKELVSMKFLVPPRWLGISTGISLAGVSSSHGDYVASQLAKKFDTPKQRATVVAAHREYARDRKAIAFTVSVKGAHELAADLSEAGFPSIAADGTTPKDTRRQILADFRAGRYQVLVNCGLWTEGLDVPEIACVHQVRPTRSDGLYLQMVGRGLRPVPNKEDCLILDYLPEETRNIALLGDLLGIPIPRERLLKKRLEQAQEGELLVQAGFTFDGSEFDCDGTPVEIVARQLHYLDKSPWRWHECDGWLTLGLGEHSDGYSRILAVPPPTDGVYRLYGLGKRVKKEDSDIPIKGDHWHAKLLAENTDLSIIGSVADRITTTRGTRTLVGKQSAWQRQPGTDGQRKFLRGLSRGKLRTKDIALLSKGDCASLITHFQAVHVLADAVVEQEVAA